MGAIQRRNFKWIGELCRRYPDLGKMKIQTHSVDGKVSVLSIFPIKKPKGVIFYIHGGGFVMGSPETEYFDVLRQLCFTTECSVYAPDYPKSPEKQFPYALDACLESWRWVCGLHPKSTRITLMGDGSGGYLAITTLIMIKQKKIKFPNSVYLLSPLNLPRNPPNFRRFPSDMNALTSTQFMRNQYFTDQIPDFCGDFSNLYKVSINECDLSNFPCCINIISSTDDFFLHDTLDIAQQIVQSNINIGKLNYGDLKFDKLTKIFIWKNLPHFFFLLPIFMPLTLKFFKWISELIRIDLNDPIVYDEDESDDIRNFRQIRQNLISYQRNGNTKLWSVVREQEYENDVGHVPVAIMTSRMDS
eukprot:c23084_g1_i1.p1 GENE.c23084_g1_i1~~c23084_g1_i1.p1  ORF type:complete len:359 (-),score=106.18 c23084_g1_i1:20-1096(-)